LVPIKNFVKTGTMIRRGIFASFNQYASFIIILKPAGGMAFDDICLFDTTKIAIENLDSR